MEKILRLCIDSGIKDPEIIPLKGDYSMRRIFRIRFTSGTLIAVSGPDIAENEAFLSFRNTFDESGFNVPGFIASNVDKSAYLISDLGDVTVKTYCEKKTAENDIAAVKKVYKMILKDLTNIQSVLYEKIDYSKCYQGDTFDRESMNRDISRFEEYFLEKYHKNYDRETFSVFKEFILTTASNAGTESFMYRDFQTRNIMLKNGKLYYIDFQSGRKGSCLYDLASFIYSSGTIAYEGYEEDLARTYYDSSSKCGKIPYDSFKILLNVFACLRLMQSAGNYAYYYFQRGDKTVEEKKHYSLNILKRLSGNLNIETGF
ncbi:MAG TPA: phosphotransferase [Clostridiales bacterium]|nr:phosphotransferase [Clostridiales bacterium]HQP70030.1 phosphotransferase [Clostridiales bacterium]